MKPRHYGTPWTETQLVLVLNQFVNHADSGISADEEAVRNLARLLRRTPGAVAMRLQNFRSIQHTGLVGPPKGLNHGGDQCERVFASWHGKAEALADFSRVTRQDLSNRELTFFDAQDEGPTLAFGRYELLDLIGEGGFGRVYSCFDVTTGARHAIKLIKPLGEPDGEARFGREIKALRAVEHSNVIKLFDANVDEFGQQPALVMELAECSLTSHLDSQPRSGWPKVLRAEAMSILRAMCAAVGALHAHSPPIAHRDLNPSNILRRFDGTWVLADFSLAKFIRPQGLAQTYRTSTNRVAGAHYYAAPEQYKALRSADHRADIYALGMLAWELLTVEGPPPDREALGLPSEVEYVHRKATARQPEDRYQAADEFLVALVEAADQAYGRESDVAV